MLNSLYFHDIIQDIKLSITSWMPFGPTSLVRDIFMAKMDAKWPQLGQIKELEVKKTWSADDVILLIKLLEELRSLIALELYQQHSGEINRWLRIMDLSLAEQILKLERGIFIEFHQNGVHVSAIAPSMLAGAVDSNSYANLPIQANTALRHQATDSRQDIPAEVNFVWFGRFPDKYVTNIRSFVMHRNHFKMRLWVDNLFATQRAFLDNQAVLKHLEIRHVDEIFSLLDHRWSKLSVQALADIDPSRLSPEDIEVKRQLMILNALDFDWKKLLTYARRELVGLVNPSASCDIFRYFILLLYGGFYTDTDLTASRQLQSPVAAHGFLVMSEAEATEQFSFQLNTCLLGSTVNHEATKLIMKKTLLQYQEIEMRLICAETLHSEIIDSIPHYYFELPGRDLPSERKNLLKLAKDLNVYIELECRNNQRIYVKKFDAERMRVIYEIAVKRIIVPHPILGSFLKHDDNGNAYLDLKIYSAEELTKFAQSLAYDIYQHAFIRLEIDPKKGVILIQQFEISPQGEFNKFINIFYKNVEGAKAGMLSFYEMDAKRKYTSNFRRELTIASSGPDIVAAALVDYAQAHATDTTKVGLSSVIFDYEMPILPEKPLRPLNTTSINNFGGIIRHCDNTWLRSTIVNGPLNAKAAEQEFPQVRERVKI